MAASELRKQMDAAPFDMPSAAPDIDLTTCGVLLGKELGKGAQGIVRLGLHMTSKRNVAMKILSDLRA